MPNLTTLESECLGLAAASDTRLQYLAYAVDAGLEKVRLILLAGKSKTQRQLTLNPALFYVSDAGDWHDTLTRVTVDDALCPPATLAVQMETGDSMEVSHLSLSDRYDILQQFVNRRIRKTAT